MSRNSPAVDLEAFRADQDATADHGQQRRIKPLISQPVAAAQASAWSRMPRITSDLASV